MFIVIIGCGRTGSRLAGHLSSAGHDLVVVDQNEETFQDLPVEFSGFEITGNAWSIIPWKRQGLKRLIYALFLQIKIKSTL